MSDVSIPTLQEFIDKCKWCNHHRNVPWLTRFDVSAREVYNELIKTGKYPHAYEFLCRSAKKYYPTKKELKQYRSTLSIYELKQYDQ